MVGVGYQDHVSGVRSRLSPVGTAPRALSLGPRGLFFVLCSSLLLPSPLIPRSFNLQRYPNFSTVPGRRRDGELRTDQLSPLAHAGEAPVLAFRARGHRAGIEAWPVITDQHNHLALVDCMVDGNMRAAGMFCDVVERLLRNPVEHDLLLGGQVGKGCAFTAHMDGTPGVEARAELVQRGIETLVIQCRRPEIGDKAPYFMQPTAAPVPEVAEQIM